jgi:hypothetical protein
MVAESHYIPSWGDRIEQTRLGVRRTGTVWYADQLQVLVKWDEGGSSSLRLGVDGIRILEHANRSASAAKTSEVVRLSVSDPELVSDLVEFLQSRADVVTTRVANDEVEVALLGSQEAPPRLTLDSLVRAWEALRLARVRLVAVSD